MGAALDPIFLCSNSLILMLCVACRHVYSAQFGHSTARPFCLVCAMCCGGVCLCRYIAAILGVKVPWHLAALHRCVCSRPRSLGVSCWSQFTGADVFVVI